MTGEGAQFAAVLERIGRAVIAQLDGLSDADLNRPLPLADTNTLFALGTHLVGAAEFWVLDACGRASERTEPSGGVPRDRAWRRSHRAVRAVADRVHEVLDDLPDTAMSRPANPPREYRNMPGMAQEGTLTVRDCLLHAVEHSALHQGHIEITRQIVLARIGEERQ